MAFPQKQCIRSSVKATRVALILLAAVVYSTGCGSVTQYARNPRTSSFKPDNYFTQYERLPSFIRRVAVLPIHASADNWYATDGQPQLQPVLQSELGKLNRFELTPVSGEDLRIWTGRAQWSAHEVLPAGFMDRIRRETGCDAVLFTQLQPYHPYRPMVMGWNFRLVDTRISTILWAAEEVFDAGRTEVAVAAKRHYEKQSPEARDLGDADRILLSPRRFSQYTLETVFASVPIR
jgi:hypothetical protein